MAVEPWLDEVAVLSKQWGVRAKCEALDTEVAVLYQRGEICARYQGGIPLKREVRNCFSESM